LADVALGEGDRTLTVLSNWVADGRRPAITDSSSRTHERGEAPMLVRDEVCGMEFEADQAKATVRLLGKAYHFCGERCKRLFEEHPERYVSIGQPHP
jgi:YHS domain-containing protein